MPLHACLLLLVYFLILGVLSTLGAHRLWILVVYFRHRRVLPRPMNAAAEPARVTVQLPLFNEKEVVERLIDAVVGLDWPAEKLEIQVLDDSTDETTPIAAASVDRWCKRGVNIRLIRRSNRVGYKAGALANGLTQASGEFIAIFDADFLPPRDFLKRALVHALPDVGMVQARWGHLNEEANALTRTSAALLDGHFVLEHTARNRSGCFFNFNGTAGVWRRACIEDAGGWHHDTLTEDIDLSYRAQLKGWRFVFLPDLVVPAELPASMSAFKVQQHRWAKGTLQVARKLLMRILRSNVAVAVKVEASVHLLSNLAYPLVLLLAVLMPLSVPLRHTLFPERFFGLELLVFGLTMVSVGLFYAAAQREIWPRRWSRTVWRLPWVLVLGIGLSPSQTRAVLEGLWGRDVTFVRTPKQGASGCLSHTPRGDWIIAVECLLVVHMGYGLMRAISLQHWGSIPFITLFFVGFAYVAGSALWGVWRPVINVQPGLPTTR